MNAHTLRQTRGIKKYSPESLEAVRTLLGQKQQRWKERHSDEEEHDRIQVRTDVEIPDLEAPFQSANVEEEMLKAHKDEDYPGPNNVNKKKDVDALSKELEDEFMDDELPWEVRSQFPSARPI